MTIAALRGADGSVVGTGVAVFEEVAAVGLVEVTAIGIPNGFVGFDSEASTVGLKVGDGVGIFVNSFTGGFGDTGVEKGFSEGTSVRLEEGDGVDGSTATVGSAVGIGDTGVEKGFSEGTSVRLVEGDVMGIFVGGIVGAKDVGIPDGAAVSSSRFKSLLDIFRALWILFDAPGVNDLSLTAPSAFIPLLIEKVLEISSTSCTEGNASP